MPLYEITNNRLTERPAGSFAELRLRERQNLQQMLLADISVLGENLLVIAEEFGQWEDARRRIDILAIDPGGRLVVIELKRNDDGAFMDLQAIRYAAMVSAMDFEQVASTHAKHVSGVMGPDEARAALEEFIESPDEGDDSPPAISTDVRIVLVAADFGRELTTAVLWLNDQGLDVRCVRIVPYDIEGRVLVDVHQVIPLQEATDYQVRLRQKERQRENADRAGRDYTRFHIVVAGTEQHPTNKRRSVLAMVRELHAHGVSMEEVASIIPGSHFIRLNGILADAAEVGSALPAGRDPARWFIDHAIHDGGHTFVVSKQWGVGTEQLLSQLAVAFPDADVTFRRADAPQS